MIQDGLSTFLLHCNERISEHLLHYNRTYCKFEATLVSLQRFLMTAFGDEFNAIHKTVWHSVNLTDGGQIFKPNLLENRKM